MLDKIKSNKKILIVSGIIIALLFLTIVVVLMVSMSNSQNERNNQDDNLADNNEVQRDMNEDQDQANFPTNNEVSNFKFERFPFDIENIGSVAPIGEFAGINRSNVSMSHFYGNMRNYVFSKFPGEYEYNVYAPSDGLIVGFRNNEMSGEFRFNFEIDSNTFYYLDHIQSLSPEIIEKLEPMFGSPLRFTNAVEGFSPGIEVKAGDIIGKTGLKGIAWDWGMIDANACDDILFPEHYMQDQCPTSVYDYFTDEMKEQIEPIAGAYGFDKNTSSGNFQKVETTPILGKYAHDIDGTLSGGWFQEYDYRNAFFVPDSYQPNMLQIRLGMPDLSLLGVWNKIAIGTGNVNPDPKLVTPESGIVSYVLGQQNRRDTSEYGVVLVRVNEDQTITIETLPNLTQAPSNPSFSSNAITLKR